MIKRNVKKELKHFTMKEESDRDFSNENDWSMVLFASTLLVHTDTRTEVVL